MTHSTARCRLVWLVLLALCLGACGQKGALYNPEPTSFTQAP